MIDQASADFGHEIPKGSRLYFGASARAKRRLESHASAVLESHGFSEIVTPFFSLHQHLSVSDEKRLDFAGPMNETISLRSDSTIDVVRIIKQRFKQHGARRVFYIQPVLAYPSVERYQIGAELISEENLRLAMDVAREILDKFALSYCVQISNTQIPRIVCELLNLEIEIFEKGREIEVLRGLNLKWIDALVRLSKPSEIPATMALLPEQLHESVQAMADLAQGQDEDNLFLAPLYYSSMRYYDRLFFRFFSGNEIYCGGGDYDIDGLQSSGFGINVDNVLEQILEKGQI